MFKLTRVFDQMLLNRHKRSWIWGSHSGDYKEFYFQVYNATQSDEIQLTLRKTILPTFPGSVCCLIYAKFLLAVRFVPEESGDMFFRNVGWLSLDYEALYSRRQNSANVKNIKEQTAKENAVSQEGLSCMELVS
jgi:hypothetical protein